MDGIEGREKVVIMGATNRPDILDKALIRPGRFDRLIYIPPPDYEARREIFKINISKMHIETIINIDELSEMTKVKYFIDKFRVFPELK
jgi:transitional endoplasmic reticulum ATPase